MQARGGAFAAFGNSRGMKKVLVIDDDRVFLRMYEMNFAFYKKQVQCITANGGREGIEKAFAEHPDLIMLDYNMPIVGGAEVSQTLRADPRTRNIPIVLITSHVTETTAEGALYDMFLPKPINDAKLRQVMEKFLGVAA